ncbi:hypothetical protein BF93_01430 [Brachybacterium phenoliresistens]|uniref:Glycosyltransferase n=1 Tax=Brachybacterium phenoliresistens TaxID=396014 RepID=Z9JSI7_9MICO|nr:hypothetical protein [Brachybacterium phenoliresistens]EWS80771.1 hypothetical protein BF93_01430 [Brachybacterium phenoliresistens]
MTEISNYSRMLHLGDPASTATLLSRAAQQRGARWDVLPFAAAPGGGAVPALLRKAARGLLWEGSLLRRRAAVPRVHVHNALARRHAGWAFGRRFALHLHGTDIRTRQYEPEHGELIRRTVRDAQVVFYSTPDLRRHVQDLREDARLVPVPVPLPGPSTAPLPPALREIGEGRPYVFFPSRWEAAKGGELQIELVRSLREAIAPSEAVLVGLDWGGRAGDASRAGATLIPTMPHAAFRSVISGASACVGQLTGVLGASELDVLAADVPLIMPLRTDWYDGSHPSLDSPPVLGGTALDLPDAPEPIVRCVLGALSGDTRSPTRDWVRSHHSPDAALDEVLRGYRESGW